MKKVFVLNGIMLAMLNLQANPKNQADVHLRITDDLPKLKTELMLWYHGVFSVTNTGEIPFKVFTGKGWSGETSRFYQEGDEEQQRLEDEHWGGKRRKEQERKEVANFYYIAIEKYPECVKTLQPGENVTFESKFCFPVPFGTSGDLYKAEMYLGHDMWVPVHITPTLGTLYAIKHDSREPAGDFYYSREGTNQYLYLKTEDGKFKRAGEMRLGSKPEKDKKEDTVTFVSPDGTTKRLTRDQARQIVNEREQKNQQE